MGHRHQDQVGDEEDRFVIVLRHILKSGPQQVFDWANLTAAELRYHAFQGDIEFAIDCTDFSARFSWIPAFDFALSFCHAMRFLEDQEQIDFTESADVINLVVVHDRVLVSASYCNGVAEAPRRELLQTADEFLRDLVDKYVTRYPGLQYSADFRKQLRGVGYNLIDRSFG